MRVLHQAAGIHVEPQKEIFDQWGRFVARADLWLVGTRRIHEYDGDGHRDRQTHRNDLARERRLVEIDWQRMGFTAIQLLHEGASIIASTDRLLGRSWGSQLDWRSDKPSHIPTPSSLAAHRAPTFLSAAERRNLLQSSERRLVIAPRRLARWEALLNDSLFRPAGRARARRHWQRAL
jgi:very-short-patch-repair endonuclease